MPNVRVRLLGPVALEIDGVTVRLGSRLRLLLAVLALAGGRPVSGARLAELLWGDPVPAAAAATLRSHLAHLRRVVEPDRPAGEPPEVVVTEEHGYALRLAAEGSDAACFERLLADGRRALKADDPEAAAEALTEALALWRGPALADLVDRSFAVAEAARLDALRRAARRALAEAGVRLGRHEDLLVELRELVAEEPADEQLRGLLALALYRSHQPEAAAAVCSDGLRLAHESGIEAPALRRIQTDILRRSPTLDRTPTPAAERPRPFQLPPDVVEFTGRDDELGRLSATTGPACVLAIDGKPGIGKSALAVRLAHRIAGRFPDGVLYVNLRGAEPHQLEPVDVLGRFLTALGADPTPAELDTASAAFRSALTGRRVLVVLDNAADAAQVRPLLPAGPHCTALVTSRRALVDLDVTAAVTLDLLSVPEAVALLGRLAGPERVDADRAAAREIVRYCGLLPLAVRIAGARLRARPGWSTAVFAARLADHRRRLAELAVGDLAVLSSFRLGYRALAPADARLFRLLGLLDGADVSAAAAAAMVSGQEADAEAALERLVDAQLLETHPAGRYRFHDLLRLFAADRAAADEPAAEREAAVARTLRWYADTATRAAQWLRPPRHREDTLSAEWADEHAAIAWLDTERANLVSAARQAAAASPAPVREVANRLDETLLNYFNIRKSWPEWQAVCLAAVTAAERADDRRGLAVASRHLGMISTQQRRLTAALRHMRYSLDIFSSLGDRFETARMHGDLGILHAQLGEYTEAIGRLTDALDVSREIGNHDMESVLLNNIGLLHCEQQRYEPAIRCVEQALAIERDLGGITRSATLETLGTIRYRQGHYRDAASAYRRSLRAARELGDRWSEAHALRGLGLAARELRGPAAAESHLRRSLAIFTALQAPEAADLERLLAGAAAGPTGTAGRPSPGRR